MAGSSCSTRERSEWSGQVIDDSEAASPRLPKCAQIWLLLIDLVTVEAVRESSVNSSYATNACQESQKPSFLQRLLRVSEINRLVVAKPRRENYNSSPYKS